MVKKTPRQIKKEAKEFLRDFFATAIPIYKFEYEGCFFILHNKYFALSFDSGRNSFWIEPYVYNQGEPKNNNPHFIIMVSRAMVEKYGSGWKHEASPNCIWIIHTNKFKK